jgi:PTH1 family peptidyl-tRNA hydrolase
MYLIVGLGNPGEKFVKTRHNAGFLTLDSLVPQAKWEHDKYSNSLLAKAEIGGQTVLLCKPQTFMNESGQATRAVLAKRGGLESNTLLVVCDDMDVEPGEIKIRNGEFAKGHNGIKSIIAHVGQSFIRVGIGVGRPQDKGTEADYVLKPFTGDQEKNFLQGIDKALQAIIDIVSSNKTSAE